MDEPTAALSGPEVERLFAVVRALRERGAAVLFISHRLDEVFAICDTVTVCATARSCTTRRSADMTTDEMVRRDGRPRARRAVPQAGRRDRRARARGRAPHARGRVHRRLASRSARGEIVALAGLVGAGRSEVARAIFGIDQPDAGHVEVAGRRLRAGPPAAAMRAGIGFVPEDRRQQGLVMDLSVERNIGLTRLRRARPRSGVIRGGAENATRPRLGAAAAAQVPPARATRSASCPAATSRRSCSASGWRPSPKLLIIDEPTRGIDVGTKAEVHRLMSRARRRRASPC